MSGPSPFPSPLLTFLRDSSLINNSSPVNSNIPALNDATVHTGITHVGLCVSMDGSITVYLNTLLYTYVCVCVCVCASRCACYLPSTPSEIDHAII